MSLKFNDDSLIKLIIITVLSFFLLLSILLILSVIFLDDLHAKKDFLSNISNIVTLVSAVTSSLALLLLSTGFILQVQQKKVSQLHAIRSMHLELLKIALDS